MRLGVYRSHRVQPRRQAPAARLLALEKLEPRTLLAPLATLATDRLALDIDTSGNVTRVADPTKGTNYLQGAPSSFAKLKIGATWYSCGSAAMDGTDVRRFLRCAK